MSGGSSLDDQGQGWEAGTLTQEVTENCEAWSHPPPCSLSPTGHLGGSPPWKGGQMRGQGSPREGLGEVGEPSPSSLGREPAHG